MTVDLPDPLTYPGRKALRISPSAYKTFKRCNTKWYLNKVLKIAEPPKDHLTLGTAIHTLAERYIKTGLKPEVSDEVARLLEREGSKTEVPIYRNGQGVARLTKDAVRAADAVIAKGYLEPLRKAYLKDEAKVELRVQGMCGPLPYLGFVDVVRAIGEDLFVTDHKSSSNPGGIYTYPKLGDIREDEQMLFYLKAVADELDVELGHWGVEHIYYPTSGRKATRVQAITSPERIENNWRKFEACAEEMKSTAQIDDPSEVAHNPNACDDFGGCPFRSICPHQQIEEATMSRLEEIRRKARALREAREGKSAAPAPTKTAPAGGPALDDETSTLDWPIDERPNVGTYVSAGERVVVLGFKANADGVVEAYVRAGKSSKEHTFARDSFEETFPTLDPYIPPVDTDIRPADAEPFTPREKKDATETVTPTPTGSVGEKSEDELLVDAAHAVHKHLVGTGLDPNEPYDVHDDTTIADLVRDTMRMQKRTRKTRELVRTKGAKLGLWQRATAKGHIVGWGATASEIPEGAAGQVPKERPVPVEQVATEPSAPVTASAPVEQVVSEPPVPTAALAGSTTVLIDAHCSLGVDLNQWLLFNDLFNVYATEVVGDDELEGLPYFAGKFSKGYQAMALIIGERLRAGVLTLPPYLQLSSHNGITEHLVSEITRSVPYGAVLIVRGSR